MNKISKIKYEIRAVFGILILLILDQLTKYLAVLHLKDQNPFILIQNVFELQYLENRGAAFSMMQGKKWFFIPLTIVFLCVILFIYLRIPKTKKYFWLRAVVVLFCSGALGNFIDRIHQGYVVDFFYFSLINFPIFNVADIYIVVGTVLLVFLIFFYYKEEDFNVIFPTKRNK